MKLAHDTTLPSAPRPAVAGPSRPAPVPARLERDRRSARALARLAPVAVAASLFAMLLPFAAPATAADAPRVAAVGDPAAGEGKAAVCAACHGGDGKALQPSYPNLAGQHPAYIAKQLTNYREGDRVNALMTGQAANLSDEDILDLSAWYGAMERHEGVAAEENLVLGEAIYKGGIAGQNVASCMGCHGPAGLGNPAAVVPALAGQNVEYTAEQLKLWRAGERSNDPNNVMGSLAHRLTDTEIAAVSNYIQGLYPAAP